MIAYGIAVLLEMSKGMVPETKNNMQYILKNKTTGQEIQQNDARGVIEWLENNRHVAVYKVSELKDAVDALGLPDSLRSATSTDELESIASQIRELIVKWTDAVEYLATHEDGFFLSFGLASLVRDAGDWLLEERSEE